MRDPGGRLRTTSLRPEEPSGKAYERLATSMEGVDIDMLGDPVTSLGLE